MDIDIQIKNFHEGNFKSNMNRPMGSLMHKKRKGKWNQDNKGHNV